MNFEPLAKNTDNFMLLKPECHELFPLRLAVKGYIIPNVSQRN